MKGWVVFILAFVIYFVSIFGGFVQDDVKVIAGDLEMGKIDSLILTWIRPYYYMDSDRSVYRPVTSFSFYINALLTGKGAWGFRLGNVLIYGWVCVVVYEVLKKLKTEKANGVRPVCRTGRLLRQTGLMNQTPTFCGEEWWRDMAFWGAVMFTVLPIHTEVVNNIVGRAEMLSLGFLLLAILKSLNKKWELSALFLVLAMLSKETAIVGVPMLLYLIWMANRVERKEKVGASVFVMMAWVGFLLLRMVVLGGMGVENKATMVENPLKFVSAEKRVMNAMALIPLGVGKIIFPVNLSYDYSYNQIKLVDSWFDWKVILGIAIAILSGIYLYRFRVKPGMTWDVRKNMRRDLRGPSSQDLMVIGMMLFWGPILITGNVLFPIGTIFGERLWFWPSLGMVFLLATIGSNRAKTVLGSPWSTGSRLRAVLASASVPLFAILIVWYAGRTVVRNLDWLSEERLFLHDANYATDSVMAQSNAAAMYLMKQDLIKGRDYLEKADKIYPKYPELLNNQGLYYLWTGKTEEAKKKFEECLTERPGYDLCKGNLELVR